MSTFIAITVLIGLFALRFAVPLALTLGVGYGLNWMVGRWGAPPEL